ncbi:MAG: hypothetical protein PVJ52_00635 [Candidatus Woesebacteria bacterium]|jgi:hypothetical protein
MDGVEKLLIVVVVVLAVMLVIVGVQVILIIVDLRKSVKRLNTLLEDSILGGGLLRPEKLTGILEMFKRKKSVEKRGNVKD